MGRFGLWQGMSRNNRVYQGVKKVTRDRMSWDIMGMVRGVKKLLRMSRNDKGYQEMTRDIKE